MNPSIPNPMELRRILDTYGRVEFYDLINNGNTGCRVSGVIDPDCGTGGSLRSDGGGGVSPTESLYLDLYHIMQFEVEDIENV